VRPIVRAAVAVFVVVPALGAVGVGAFVYHDARSTVDAAEPTTATVVNSTVERELDRSGDTERYQYRPAVRYRYTVDNQTYTSDSVFPGGERTRGGTDAREWARGVVADHPEGEQVRAYYLPDDPERSFLIAQAPTTLALAFVGMGVLGSLGGVATLLFG